jgi:hypothetical protein
MRAAHIIDLTWKIMYNGIIMDELYNRIELLYAYENSESEVI